LTVALRAEAGAEADRAAAMAGPKATAGVLSLLPVAGIALGMLIGADPAGTLFTTPLGRGCLLVGFALWVLGVWWARRLVDRATRAGLQP
jgi:tight adherence protein B